MTLAVDHINIVVSNLEQSLQFYTTLLGFEQSRRAHLQGEWIEAIVGLKGVSAEVAYIRAPAGEPRVELLCYRMPKGETLPACSLANTIGLRHLALRVENIHDMVERLQKGGVSFLGEPVTVPDGIVQHEAGSKTLVYFTDPDGVLLELAEYR